MNSIMPQNTLEQLVVLGTVFVILLVVGIYFILAIRRQVKEPEKITADDLLLRFSKLHDAGLLTKEEYRAIKLNLASQLGEELQERMEGLSGGEKGKTQKPRSQGAGIDTEALLAQLLAHESRLTGQQSASGSNPTGSNPTGSTAGQTVGPTTLTDRNIPSNPTVHIVPVPQQTNPTGKTK